ncbi:MAG TPA: class I SAM-dependent methyltransferase [Anaerolineales bacterium]|nr:class I SAM-dependent methyltransferase [Anaerolineales bacterium]HLO27879.1 class I SAM-dependent methyltransferase [Anaerolineales bacterium]
MDWHTRYLQQATWTRDLRAYLFKNAGLDDASRVHTAAQRRASLVLEVGCGTGAILSELPGHTSLHGLDLDAEALIQCRTHAPGVSLVQGNALQLPYSNAIFEIVYCHFLLLWVNDPLQALLEMKRVGKPGAHIIAFAEPDYTRRVDEPSELLALGQWQSESLKRQGADPGLGARLANLFLRAGIKIIETGTIQNTGRNPSPEEWEIEWAVLESDLAGFISSGDLHKMKKLDQAAWERGDRVLYVPTYFAWGHT